MNLSAFRRGVASSNHSSVKISSLQAKVCARSSVGRSCCHLRRGAISCGICASSPCPWFLHHCSGAELRPKMRRNLDKDFYLRCLEFLSRAYLFLLIERVP
ncbi:unnamed protein product, partial [Ectocarpus sp. 12 AP-2014]